MGFSQQEYRSRLPCPPPGDLPDPGIKLTSPAFQVSSLSAEPLGKPTTNYNKYRKQGFAESCLLHSGYPRISWNREKRSVSGWGKWGEREKEETAKMHQEFGSRVGGGKYEEGQTS